MVGWAAGGWPRPAPGCCSPPPSGSTGFRSARRAWLGALLGLAVVRGIEWRTGLDAALKWPNDVLIDDRKVAGLLAEVVGDLVVVGAGINVTTTASELPRPDACSLASAGAADPDRAVLLAAVLQRLRRTRGHLDVSRR